MWTVRKRKRPSMGLPWKLAGCGRPFLFLNAGEFESRIPPKVPKSSRFASPVRYFYFTLPDFVNACLLFWIIPFFFFWTQKSRTEVRDFCLHLFCQCKLVRVTGLEPAASWPPVKRDTKLRHTRKYSVFHKPWVYYHIAREKARGKTKNFSWNQKICWRRKCFSSTPPIR